MPIDEVQSVCFVGAGTMDVKPSRELKKNVDFLQTQIIDKEEVP